MRVKFTATPEEVKLAEDAIAEQDTVQMTRLYGVLKGNK